MSLDPGAGMRPNGEVRRDGCNTLTHDLLDRYRSADGSCNNLKEANFGRANTPFQRILLPEYAAGTIDLPRKSSVDGDDLPSARVISTILTRDSNDVNTDGLHTMLVMQMGQFVDHDITHTPNYNQVCCSKKTPWPGRDDPERCFPIRVPEDDPFWSGRDRKRDCLSFSRSLPSPGLKCSLEFRQQMNQITHWLDASNIYGSSQKMTRALRRFVGGQLQMTRRTSGEKEALPFCSAGSNMEAEGSCSRCSSCFLAGDARANEQLNLIVMHTVWLREHNRVARALRKLNPRWGDERLFQEARRIVTAEYQHILYKEWLPTILGKDFMTTFGLWPLSKGYSKAYRDDFDPRITNEFATAAYRFGHTLIPSLFERVRRTRSGNGLTSSMKMREMFFRPSMLRRDSGLLNDLVRGMAGQESEAWDDAFSEDVKNHLFEVTQGAGGMDLPAMNIQRGRDHGLPGER